ncbi:hypothetical protein Daesc_007735 [Daldinia eschscholtzii]|uniref:Arca-like protein n=1 Tax=Daldinia eschscholtzii TaxID=292717 RepID=A0AAX6MFD3_9PEZI
MQVRLANSYQVIYVDERRGLTIGAPEEDSSQYEFHTGESHNWQQESTSSSVTPPVIPNPTEYSRVGGHLVDDVQPQGIPKSNGRFPNGSTSVSELHTQRPIPGPKSTSSYVLPLVDVESRLPTTGQDTYSHLLGIHAFVNVGDQYMGPGSLSAASFWVGLRQEIYIAVITQQPVKVSLDHFVVDRSFEPADDYTWSNRAIVLLADVLNLCFGNNTLTIGHWRALDEACKKWASTRPPSFNPFFYQGRTASSAFPEIWHGSGCHVIGIQHHILAQLFLTQFDPSIPKVGTNRRAAVKQMTHRIENLVRELCGIGICNQWTPPGMFTACMGIAMFGDQFGERSDQEALLDILRKTEADHARPTASIQQQLMRAWGWLPDNDE